MMITKKSERKTWEKTLTRRGTTGQPPASRTASQLPVVRKPSKYHAKPTVSHGIRFDSRKEADRYQQLLLLARAGDIDGLELQPVYELSVPAGDAGSGRIRLGEYRGDFRYWETVNRGKVTAYAQVVVEDVKGFKTPLYKWKKRHVEAQYGLVIREL